MAEELKVNYELGVAGWLVEQLGREGQQLSEPVAGDIHLREPDAVCESPSGRVGIEVAAAYYNDEEARNVWAMARGTPERSSRYLAPGVNLRDFARRLPVLVNFTAHLVKGLRRTLDDHCRKTYCVPSHLVMDVTHAALTTTDEAPGILAELQVPVDCPFIAVYVAFSENWSKKVLLFELARPPLEPEC